MEFYENGVIVKEWNDELRQYIERNSDGVEVLRLDYTDEENAEADARAEAEAESVNEASLIAKGAAALSKNHDFLALASPTNADALAQIRALTRQVNALIRLEIRDLADISDT